MLTAREPRETSKTPGARPFVGALLLALVLYLALTWLVGSRSRLFEPLEAVFWGFEGLAIGALVVFVQEPAGRLAAGLALLLAGLVGAVANVPVLSVLAGGHGVWTASAVMLTLGIAPTIGRRIIGRAPTSTDPSNGMDPALK